MPLPDQRGRGVRVLLQWFDILFVMVLCFATLLTTILVQPTDDGTSVDHAFSWWAFAGVVALFLAYLVYMLRHSNRELAEMVDHVYGPSEETSQQGDRP